MKDKEKYCIKCGHRSNTTRKNYAPNVPLRCRKCGYKLLRWDRNTNTYI